MDELERHRDELCLAFASKMEEALLSTDLQMVNDLLVESEPLGGDVQQLREAVTRHYNRLLEKTCAKLQALCQSDDYALIGETLDQHADDVHDYLLQTPQYAALARFPEVRALLSEQLRSGLRDRLHVGGGVFGS